MKIKNLKKCLAGTLSFLMVSSITMLPASALSYPTDLSMAQLNFSVSNTVSAPKNNLSAMYNSRASGMASSAVKTNAGYENQGGTPSAYGKTAQDVYNEVGDKNFIANSGWQAWGSQNASSMPDYNSLIATKQSTVEGIYNSAVDEMPENATNAANMALADLLGNNPTAATVFNKAHEDYASASAAKAISEAGITDVTSGLEGLDNASKHAVIEQNYENYLAYNNADAIIANTTNKGLRTDTFIEPIAIDDTFTSLTNLLNTNSVATGITVSSAPAFSSYGTYGTYGTDIDTTNFDWSMPVFSYSGSINWDETLASFGNMSGDSVSKSIPLTELQKKKLELAGIPKEAAAYSAYTANNLTVEDISEGVITEYDTDTIVKETISDDKMMNSFNASLGLPENY